MLLAKAFTMANLLSPSPARLPGFFLLLKSHSFFQLLPVMFPSYFSLYLLFIWIFSESLWEKEKGFRQGAGGEVSKDEAHPGS